MGVARMRGGIGGAVSLGRILCALVELLLLFALRLLAGGFILPLALLLILVSAFVLFHADTFLFYGYS